MDKKILIEEIKESISFFDLLEHYGIETDRSHRMPCIFHNGDDNNLGFKEHYCHCFVCGEGGDIIKFMQVYFDLSFIEAIEKLNRDFNLGLPLGRRVSLREKQKMADAKKKRDRDKEQKEREHEGLLKDWEDCITKYRELSEKIKKFKPKSEEEPINPQFFEALKEIGYIEYRMGIAETRLMAWN